MTRAWAAASLAALLLISARADDEPQLPAAEARPLRKLVQQPRLDAPGGPVQLSGMWVSPIRFPGDALAVGQATEQGFVFVTYGSDSVPTSLLAAAVSHTCLNASAAATTPDTTAAAPYSVVYDMAFLAPNGTATDAFWQCQASAANATAWGYRMGASAPDAAAAAAGCPPADDFTPQETNARVPEAALGDASAAPCSAAGAAAALGDASAPVDVAAVYPPFEFPYGGLPGTGFYKSTKEPHASIGLQSRFGFQYAGWSAADGLSFFTGEYTSHRCIPGAPLSFQATGSKRTVYFNGTATRARPLCETVRYDPAERQLLVLTAYDGDPCPPEAFPDGDANFIADLYAEDAGLGAGPSTPCLTSGASGAARAAAAAAALALALL